MTQVDDRLSEAVLKRGLRVVAKEVGVNHQTLSNYLEDPSKTSTRTEELVRRWLAGGSVREVPPTYGGNRAIIWIGNFEHTSALRRGEGEITYGDAAIDGMAEAREKKWNAEELLTALDWLAAKLHWSEQQRIALQRAARGRGDQQGA
jgi:hypothetical protein